MYQNIEPNPWGCRIRAHDPHESDLNPGPGNVQAKATIECPVTPPANVATIWQELSKWEGSDLAIEGINNSLAHPAYVIPGLTAILHYEIEC